MLEVKAGVGGSAAVTNLSSFQTRGRLSTDKLPTGLKRVLFSINTFQSVSSCPLGYLLRSGSLPPAVPQNPFSLHPHQHLFPVFFPFYIFKSSAQGNSINYHDGSNFHMYRRKQVTPNAFTTGESLSMSDKEGTANAGQGQETS